MPDHKQKLIVKLIVFIIILVLVWYIGYLTGRQSNLDSVNQNNKLMDNGGGQPTGQLPSPPPIVGELNGELPASNGFPLPPPIVE